MLHHPRDFLLRRCLPICRGPPRTSSLLPIILPRLLQVFPSWAAPSSPRVASIRMVCLQNISLKRTVVNTLFSFPGKIASKATDTKPSRCDASRTGFSKLSTLCLVYLPTPRTFQALLLIIPCWVVPSATGFVNSTPTHLKHVSLEFVIVDAWVSFLPHIKLLGFLCALPSQGSAFRRRARYKLHHAHLNVC